VLLEACHFDRNEERPLVDNGCFLISMPFEDDGVESLKKFDVKEIWQAESMKLIKLI
jgi:hypothetical protein